MVKIEYNFDPFEIAGVDPDDVTRAVRNEILASVADYTLDQVLSDVGDQTSPVTGGAFRKLNKDYALIKKKKGGRPVPDLELDGDMLGALRVKKKDNEVSLYIPAGLQAKKADNHNKFSPESETTAVPARKFIPNEAKGETFRASIRKGIRTIVLEAFDEHREDDG